MELITALRNGLARHNESYALNKSLPFKPRRCPKSPCIESSRDFVCLVTYESSVRWPEQTSDG